ncbi:sensor histidine kinase [Anthocerotibacter panamensis]|uniref:sensor histidine kinase n=1 Tax=Anthocerotibacter panamensis TaxID=2857077 RepID=UPI001C40267B|nr:HAMP domain-containing sensor histidine kinase [Anthocerotibacter panamensis]
MKTSWTKILNLRVRLFLALTSVVFFCLVAVFVVGWSVAPLYFNQHLVSLHITRPEVMLVEEELRDGFTYAWVTGSAWALGLSLPLALGLSLFVSRRIVQPLTAIQAGTAQFAAGHFERRINAVDIPELDRLILSFNTLADSIQEVEQHRQGLVADLAHELRTPLTVIGGYLEGLQDGSIAADPIIYRRLSRETQRLCKLVCDLQELSKAEAGYLPLEVKPLALAPLGREIIEKLSVQTLEDGPTFTLSLGNLPMVLADPFRVEQILINLLSNALRHTAEGSIHVGGSDRGAFVELYVRDTGTGISQEDLTHIFERFWRSDQSRTRETGGSGIGLTIVKKLVEIQGGKIWVESTLGQGSTFYFTLPVVATFAPA